MMQPVTFPPHETFSSRFTISTLVLRDRAPVNEQTLTSIAEAGFYGIELLEDPNQFDLADKTSLHEIVRICTACGLSIVSFHAHFLNFDAISTNAELQKKLDICYRQIDTLEECGGSFWASHLRMTNSIAIKALESLARYVEDRPVHLGIENFVTEGMWVEDRLACLQEIQSPKVGLLLDIGHIRNHRGKNPMTMAKQARKVILQVKPYLKHVHLHGFIDGVDHYPPFHPGDTIQWPEILQTLEEIGYSGFYNFEPKGRPDYLSSIERTGHFYTNWRNHLESEQ
jgi:sugar phosphate isomerase/epimerase